MMLEPIKLSLFDIFKAGPGPSSSHTIGPMCAAKKFVELASRLPESKLSKTDQIQVRLYGSLSATGKGHGTDRAVVAGFLGMEPQSCDIEKLAGLFSRGDEVYDVRFGKRVIPFRSGDIHFDSVKHSFPFQNTMTVSLLSDGRPFFEMEFYSTGGGFIRWKGDAPEVRPSPPFPYGNMSEFKNVLRSSGLSFDQLMIKNEMAITAMPERKIFEKLDSLISIMLDSVERGLSVDGVLPGPIGLQRKAKALYDKVLQDMSDNPEKHGIVRSIVRLNSYAFAASEENAAGRLVVTAPTSGAAGVIPAILYFLRDRFSKSDQELRNGMLAAGLIAFIAKQNASISGAEVGCQGEVGVASSMAAALLAHVNGDPVEVIENAAEIALEHRLGMTCDPIKGYVQIPCIERNAVAAIEAYNAYMLASTGDPSKQKISFDQVLESMMRTGRDMSNKYKETSEGGLALCDTIC